MKVSEHWLRSIIDPPNSIKELEEKLTSAGLEIDTVEAINGDTVWTLKTPANRGDCLSMIGIAREISALTDLPTKEITNKEVIIPNINKIPVIQCFEPKACPRYTARIIQNINPNSQCPTKIIDRLQKAGIRSISPVVDITNYVMLELGQPLHAFDLDQLSSEEIQIRFAKKGETLTTLDNQKLNLNENTLVIADHKKPQAIAGIIGGLDSAVTDKTTNILIECAYFEPNIIRTTARQYGLRTESSIRFERGIDPYLQSEALDRITALLLEIVGGNIGPVVEQSNEINLPEKTKKIWLRSSRIYKILGITLSDQEIYSILNRLGMQVETLDHTHPEKGFLVHIPSFRADLQQEEDLVEEIIRVYGYHQIPGENPSVSFQYKNISEKKLSLEELKKMLISRGYFEAINYSFISEDLIKLFLPDETPLLLENPISTELGAMRPTLIPGLLQNILHNQHRQLQRVRLFETASIFKKEENDWKEKNKIAGICVGTVLPEQWGIKTKNVDFFDVKADIEAMLHMTHNQNVSFVPSKLSFYHPGKSSDIKGGNKILGNIGHLHPKLLKKLGIEEEVVCFELDCDLLLEKKIPKFQEISKYPSIRRDMALIVKEEIKARDLISLTEKAAGPLLKEVILFDMYQGKGIDPGSKSLGLGLILQHPSRTLVDTEVNEVMQRVIQSLIQQFHAILRE